MAKVVIAGETFDFDGQRQPMSEALAIEDVYGRRYAEWQQDLQAGSAKAFCVLAWIIWRREGRDVPFEDIIGGKVDFDLVEMLQSMTESAEAEQGAVDPPVSPGPAGTGGTGTGTSSSSPASSGSARSRSGSSKSPTSRP